MPDPEAAAEALAEYRAEVARGEHLSAREAQDGADRAADAAERVEDERWGE